MSFHIGEQATPRLHRSELAVPGSQPKLFEKAAASQADVIFLDLEDAVAPDDKVQARKNVIEAVNDIDWTGKTITVRVNGLATGLTRDDLEAIVLPFQPLSLQRWHLSQATRAPGGPEVDHQRLPAQVAQTNKGVIKIQRLEVTGQVAGVDAGRSVPGAGWGIDEARRFAAREQQVRQQSEEAGEQDGRGGGARRADARQHPLKERGLFVVRQIF